MAMQVLTAILIVVTAFYAYANYRTMRIMEADVRSRTQPIPSLSVTSQLVTDSIPDSLDPNSESVGSEFEVKLVLRSSNAVLMLESIELIVAIGGDPDDDEHVTLFDSRHLRPITLDQNATFLHQFEVADTVLPIPKYQVVVTYYDLAKSFKFVTFFDGDTPRFTVNVNDAPLSPL